jgi:AcrR family transcriptional regulator
LVREGFERITTRRIAEEAGVNIATLHYYFGNKESLLDETMRFALASVVERLDRAMGGAANLSECLRLGLAEYWEIVRDQPGILRFDLAVRGFRDDSARAKSAFLLDELNRMTVELLGGFGGARPDGFYEPIAHFLVSSLDGITLSYLVSRDPERALRAMDLLREQVLILCGVEPGDSR